MEPSVIVVSHLLHSSFCSLARFKPYYRVLPGPLARLERENRKAPVWHFYLFDDISFPYWWLKAVNYTPTKRQYFEWLAFRDVLNAWLDDKIDDKTFKIKEKNFYHGLRPHLPR